LRASPGDEIGVNPVGDGRNQHFRPRHPRGEALGIKGGVGLVALQPEQFGHARLDSLGETARQHDKRFVFRHETAPSRFVVRG